jgi:hypothetical protein
VISKAKLAASSIIVAGAALVGARAGWDVTLVTVELDSNQLSILGGTTAAILAAVACKFAQEGAEARARRRDSMLWLEEKRRRYGWKAPSRLKATQAAVPAAASPRGTTWKDRSLMKATQALAWVRREHHDPGEASIKVGPSERGKFQ